MTIVLAADLGGTTTKAALVSSDGDVIAEASVPAPQPDASGLVSPPDWWTGFLRAAAMLRAEKASDFALVAAISVTGVTRTPVVVDKQGNALAGAITARDTRAQEVAARTKVDLPDRPESQHYDAFHPAARLKWLSASLPSALTRMASVVDPKDFVAAQLTARIASDPVALARLIAAADTTDGSSLLARLGLPDDIVPGLLRPTAIIERTRAGLPEPFAALSGKPVVMASHDTWAGVVGLGALTPGRAYNVSGTTETFGVMTTKPVKAPGLMDVRWGDDLHQIGGPGQNGADVLNWLGTLIGADAPDDTAGQIARVLTEPRHLTPLLFLPYLFGERVPFWDADLRAAFLGLSRAHGPADLTWAVLEGVAFLNRIVLGRAEAAANLIVDEVRLGGGAARIPVWAQIKADVLERPVSTVTVSEPGVLGAAIAAFVGLGAFASLAEAQQLLVRKERTFEPQPAKRDFYRTLGLLFDEAHDAVRPLSHQLTKLSVPQ